jgi:hypothetical protein
VGRATPHVHETEGWVVYVSPNPVLLVIPEGGPWVAATSHTGAKVDLCRSIARGAGYVEFVDLELDVVWRWGEPAQVLDAEEFDALALPDAAAYQAEAERIRACVDAGEEPFGPAFRGRLVELARPVDPLLGSTWAAGTGPLLVGDVSALVALAWLDRQRAGAGWLLCGGGDGEVTAVAWVDAGGEDVLVATTNTAEAAAMGSFLVACAPRLRSYPPPPLPLVAGD